MPPFACSGGRRPHPAGGARRGPARPVLLPCHLAAHRRLGLVARSRLSARARRAAAPSLRRQRPLPRRHPAPGHLAEGVAHAISMRLLPHFVRRRDRDRHGRVQAVIEDAATGPRPYLAMGPDLAGLTIAWAVMAPATPQAHDILWAGDARRPAVLRVRGMVVPLRRTPGLRGTGARLVLAAVAHHPADVQPVTPAAFTRSRPIPIASAASGFSLPFPAPSASSSWRSRRCSPPVGPRREVS